MRKKIAEKVKEYMEDHIKRRTLLIIMCILSLCTVLSVYGVMMIPAISMEKKNPLLTASPSEAVIGEVLKAHVTAVADPDLEETVIYLSSYMDNAELSEEIIFDEEAIAAILTQNGKLLKLHRAIKEEGKLEDYWFILNKGESVEFDLPFISWQIPTECDTATPSDAAMDSVLKNDKYIDIDDEIIDEDLEFELLNDEENATPSNATPSNATPSNATPSNATSSNAMSSNTVNNNNLDMSSVVIYAGMGQTANLAINDLDEKNADIQVSSIVLTWMSEDVLLDISPSSTHDIIWLRGSNAVIDGNIMDITPDKNQKQSATLQVQYSSGGENEIPVGAVEIRIPAHIFMKRDGTSADTATVPLSKKGTPSGDTGFWYEIDNNGTDISEDDEIVISNFQAISGASFFQCDIKFEYLPSDVADGYDNSNIKAIFQIPNKGGDIVTLESDSTLTIRIHTQAKLYTFSKMDVLKYELWRDDWGEKPIDSEDYFFVWWRLNVGLLYNNTQPFVFTVSDDDNVGTMVGGFVSGVDTIPSNRPITVWAQNGNLSMQTDISLPENYSKNYYYCFLVKYPRTLLDNLKEGESLTVSNTAICTLRGYDGAIDEKTATDSYKYIPPNNTYPGYEYYFSKQGSNNRTQGGVNLLESGISVSEAYTIYARTQYYDSADKNPESRVEIVDGEGRGDGKGLGIYDKATILTPGEDYYVTGIHLTSYSEQDIIYSDLGGYQKQEVTKDEYDPIPIYIKTEDNPDEWVLYGTYNKDTLISFTYNATGKISYASIDFPEKTIAFKADYKKTHAYSAPTFRVYIKYNPSQQLKELCADVKVGKELTVYNKAYMTIKNTRGDIVHEDDSVGYYKLSRVEPKTYADKRYVSVKNDTVNSRVVTNWRCNIRDSFDVSGLSDYTNMINPYTSGYFYDLLPEGTTVENLKVSGKKGKKNVNWTTEFIDNWRNSGRTMMILYITSENEIPNSNNSIGYDITYDLISTWVNIRDNGTILNNYAAYQSTCGNLASGWPDDNIGSSDSMWDYFEDLDQDGNINPDLKNTVYMDMSFTIDEPFFAEAGFKKQVKAEAGGDYSTETIVDINKDYSYKLRYETRENNLSSNLIFYDVLENAFESDEYWQGELVGISTANATNKGADVKVYYSTLSGIQPYDKTGILEEGDLNNTAYWSESPPDDLSKVTALAFDLRKNISGGDFTLADGASTYVEIFMRASLKDSTVLDRASTSKIKAYNDSGCHTTTTPVSGGASTAVEPSAVVTVELRQTAKLNVSKIWSDSDTVDHSADSVTVYLLADGINTGNKLILNEANGWKGSFDNLDAKHEDNTKIIYTVEEEKIPNYVASYTNSGSSEDGNQDDHWIVITNTYSPPTFELTLHKTNIGGTESLEGVQFALYQATVDAEGNWIQTDPNTTCFNGTTGGDGVLVLTNLLSGNYLLYETKAADGYRLPEKPWRIALSSDGIFTVMDSKGNKVEIVNDAYQITNETGFRLPSAGGSGVRLYTTGGLMLLLLAGFIYGFLKRRKEGGSF